MKQGCPGAAGRYRVLSGRLRVLLASAALECIQVERMAQRLPSYCRLNHSNIIQSDQDTGPNARENLEDYMPSQY